MEEFVVLIDRDDNEIGVMEKQQAHVAGLLHRAFSVFVFNSAGDLLIQQRAASKYHSPLLWANTCCSHPRKGETYLEAAHRRLVEEMGFDCELEEKFHFIYKARLGEYLFEHELDRVFTGTYEGPLKVNTGEVEAYRWVPWEELKEDVKSQPEKYTAWFKIIFSEYLEKLRDENND